MLLHLTVDRDPEKYGPYISAFLAVECPSSDASKAKEAFLQILEQIPELKLALFSVAEVNGKRELKQHLDNLQRIDLDKTPMERFISWLEKESQDANSEYWCTKDTEDEIDVGDAGASHRLRGSQAWSAPVPHQLSLTQAFRVSEILPSNGDYLLVPYLGNKPPQPEAVSITVLEDIWTLSGEWLKVGDIALTVRSHPLEKPKADHLGDLLSEEGYLKAPKDIDQSFRYLSYLERHATDLFSTESVLPNQPRKFRVVDSILLWLARPTREGRKGFLEAIVQAATWLEGLSELDTSDPNTLRGIGEKLLDKEFPGFEKARDEALEVLRSSQTYYESVARIASIEYAGLLIGSPGDPAKDTKIIASYLRARLGLAGEGDEKFPDWVVKLPKISIPTDTQAVVKGSIERRREMLEKLLSGIKNEASTVFTPDSKPEPLPIQVCKNFDAQLIDQFGWDFNGLAFAIRRLDLLPDGDLWAHANLASFHFYQSDKAESDDVPLAIDPILPVTVDGRGLMFVNYEGFPFSSAAFSQTRLDQEGGATVKPFYRSDVADFGDEALGRFQPLPSLAYGRRFELFSFAVTKGGSLPEKLADPTYPWKPKPEVEAPADPTFISSVLYQRRTALGAVVLTTQNRELTRVGQAIEGVQPLANDYPRVGLLATKDDPAVVDLFQSPEGLGLLVFPENGKTLEYRIEDFRVSGECTLTLHFFSGHALGPNAGADVSLPSWKFEGDSLILRFQTEQNQSRIQLNSLPYKQVEKSTPLWLRLEVVADSESRVGLSFVDPSEVMRRRADGVLLLSSSEEQIWRREIPSSVVYWIQSPCVSFLDFDRWFANPDLRRAAFPNKEDNTEVRDRIDAFFELLLYAYVHRHRNQELAEALSALPDPAVCAVRLELLATDWIVPGDDDSNTAHVRTLDYRGKFTEFLAEGTIGQRTVKDFLKDSGLWKEPASLVEYFRSLRGWFSQRIEIASSRQLSVSPDQEVISRTQTVRLEIPSGFVAELLLWPLVAETNFDSKDHPSVFHDGMKQLSSREVTIPNRPDDGQPKSKGLAFAPLSTRIEVMLGLKVKAPEQAKAMADDALKCVLHPKLRKYDLVVHPLSLHNNTSHYHHWRQFGQIEVTTQRWRPSGQPVYHYLDPVTSYDASHRADSKGMSQTSEVLIDLAALPVRCDERFEKDAFAGRDDEDAVTAPPVRLLSLPPSSKFAISSDVDNSSLGQFLIETFNWDQPSATYFRHRYRLWSRYAGAIRANRDSFVDTHNDDQPWNLRIAMLADSARVELTRPQLRALLPLTTTPSQIDTICPPVLALLQEPPYSRTGLAERVAAEVKTGWNWSFEEKRLAITDARKEIGRDSRLTYQSLDSSRGLKMSLEAEGPVGLTYDGTATRSAVFANSTYVLTPRFPSKSGDDLQEHFLAVLLRRYIDPNWLVKREQTPRLLEASDCWHISWPKAEVESWGTQPMELLVQEGGGSTVLLWEAGKFSVPPKLLDPLAEVSSKPILLAEAEAFEEIILLHQEISPGSYCLSIFLRPLWGSGAGDQASSHPRLLSSLEWSGGHGIRLRPASGAKAEKSMASLATALTWTRTQRDFDRWLARNKSSSRWFRFGEEIQARRIDKDTLSFFDSSSGDNLWLQSSIHGDDNQKARIPLHVHRHLSVFTTKLTDSPGRPLETYIDAALYEGKTIKVNSTARYVRIFEFETPAAILCNKSLTAAPETFKLSYFDLVSRGLEQARRLKLFIRAVTKEKMRLAAILTKPNSSTSTMTIDLGEVVGPNSLTLTLDLSEDRTLKPSKITIGRFSDIGDYEENDHEMTSAMTTEDLLGGFILELVTDKTECWFDVSLLGSRSKISQGFDFDWLFPRDPNSTDSFPVQSKSLRNLKEAQARIIAISPPVEIL